jgi:SlyX protein
LNEADVLRARVDTLEMRVMQQDQTIEDLNETITAQWRFIDGLVRQVATLDDRMRDSNASSAMPSEPPPPHY